MKLTLADYKKALNQQAKINKDKKMKSIIEEIKNLKMLADLDTCDGECESVNELHTPCCECKARTLLNEIGD